MKGFGNTERQLKAQIAEVEAKDESLVTKLEDAVCFGKVMFSGRPVKVKEFGLLLTSV